MSVSLSEGGVALSVALGTGNLDTRIDPPGAGSAAVGFDDNNWHHVIVQRHSAEVTLTVDGIYMEQWKTSGMFSVLASNTVFVGGSEERLSQPDNEQNKAATSTNINLVGCMKKVVYRMDGLVMNLLEMAQSSSTSFVSVIGELEWKCRDIGPGSPLPYTSDSNQNYMTSSYFAHQKQQGGVISFTREEAFLVLPHWKSSMSGSLSFKFRTIEPNGLLLFNGGIVGSSGKDYFAMELQEGHLFVHLELGSGPVKVKASRYELNDGSWHKVALTLRKQNGRVSIDGDAEVFQTPGESTQLDLGGDLYIGSVDYMDPELRLPPAVWSGTLRYGFVGCMQEFFMNGAAIDVVQLAHQQDVGSIRSSCHRMPEACHDRPCMHGGKCFEGWNRYICQCEHTSFAGASCGNSATTLKFHGNNSMSLRYERGATNEADDLTLRFRSREQNGLLMSTRHDRSADRLEVTLEAGRVRVKVEMGQAEKSVYAGHSLNDDIYHTVVFRRRGTKIRLTVDENDPVFAEVVTGSQSLYMGYSKIYFGGIEQGEIIVSQAPGMVGYLSQVYFNGQHILELWRSGQLESRLRANNNAELIESPIEEAVHHAVSFAAANTYIGLPQMKAYNSINVRFMFRTFEANSLIMFNAGKAQDFFSVELINGRLHYTLNLGYGPISVKDETGSSLSDNKWHQVSIGRPSRYRHTLMVDGHKAETTTKGDNYHLDLDGILYLGGVRPEMYKDLPRPMVSQSGFQGCIASLETNGELTDAINHALVPSVYVEEGCEDSVTYEWLLENCVRSRGAALVTYEYPSDKLPDTKDDILTFGFITPSLDAVLFRVDSRGGESHNDYLQIEISGGKVFVNYNLGSKDITFGDLMTKVNDGRYHTVRFVRSDINATIQVDDRPVQTKFPQGNKHYSKTTVFNDQSLIQIGGHYSKGRVRRPYAGIIAGVNYNGLRPLDLAAKKDYRTKITPNSAAGTVKHLPGGIPFDYKSKHPELFTKECLKAQMDEYDKDKGPGSENCDDEDDCIGGSGSGESPVDHRIDDSNNSYDPPTTDNNNKKPDEDKPDDDDIDIYGEPGSKDRSVSGAAKLMDMSSSSCLTTAFVLVASTLLLQKLN